ncbi:MAG: DUF433 domain-containing protein [Microcystis panniformis Mp_MB_F_20080800_S26D]|nr:MAG: DUF433 domain-containing protein [Microcystis panniformis Mp_MB_F_20080800_S26D]
MTTTLINHIEITPETCGGKPRIAGHRIKVQLADVYAALSYYHDHLEEIRQQITDDDTFAKEMQAKTPSLVQEKLKKMNGQ